jgi:hypothetical protein
MLGCPVNICSIPDLAGIPVIALSLPRAVLSGENLPLYQETGVKAKREFRITGFPLGWW